MEARQLIKYLTVKQFIEKYKGGWPSESALRAMICDADWGKQGFQEAFLKIGRRRLIDDEVFWQCVQKLNERK